MDRTMSESYQISEGAEVRSSDNEKLGKVVSMSNNDLVVEKGFFFPTDYHIPASVISSYDGDTVYLSITKDEAVNGNWVTEPQTVTTSNDQYATGYAAAAPVQETGGSFAHETDPQLTHQTTDDHMTVQVHEEELTATKRAVERGQVRVEKDVISEEKTLEVPITEERVTIQRRVVDRDAAVDGNAFEEGTIEIPLRSEEVDLQKRVRVVEEIEIGKDAVQRTERVAGTVRREEVRVDDSTGGTMTSDAGTGLLDRAADTVEGAVDRAKKPR